MNKPSFPITVLEALPHTKGGAVPVLTKVYRRSKPGKYQKFDYDLGKWFKSRSGVIDGIDSLAQLIAKLQTRKHHCIIRGKLVAGANRDRHRRCLGLNDDKSGGYVGQPSRLITLDFDGIAYRGDTNADPEAAIRFLISLLPPEFTGASCVWYFSSSHGRPQKRGKIYARLFFIADRFFTDDELRGWAYAINSAFGDKLIDPALFNAVQICYTCAPQFEGGMIDWVRQRFGVLKGDRETVPLVLLAKPDAPPTRKLTVNAAVGIPTTEAVAPSTVPKAPRPESGATGFEGHLGEIGGPCGFRDPIYWAMCSWFGTHGPEADPAPMLERLREVCAAVPATERLQSTLGRYIDEQLPRARQFIAVNPRSSIGAADEFDEITDGSALPVYWPGPTGDRAQGLADLNTAITAWFDRAEVEALSVAWRKSFRDRMRVRIVARAEKAATAKAAELGYPDVIFGGVAPEFDDLTVPEEVNKAGKKAMRSYLRKGFKRIRAATEKRFGKPCTSGSRVQITAAAGSGKTASLARELKARPHLTRHGVTWICAPDLSLCEQIWRDLRSAGIPAQLVRGRSAQRPDGKGTMCQIADVAEEIGAAGLEVGKTLCRRCEHAERCKIDGYLSQRTREKGVFVLTQNYLTLPGAPVPRPDVLVIDETIWRLCVRRTQVRPTELTVPPGFAEADDNTKWRAVTRALRDAVEGPKALAVVRTTIGVEAVEWLREAARRWVTLLLEALDRELESGGEGVRKVVGRYKAILHKARGVRRLADAVLRELHRPAAEFNAVAFNPRARLRSESDGQWVEGEAIEIDWLGELAIPEKVPVLMLDASADVTINRRLLGNRLADASVKIERNAEIVQVGSRVFTRAEVVGVTNDDPKAAKVRGEIAAFVRQVQERHGPTLVCGYMDAAEEIGEAAGAAVSLHYGRLRGVNSGSGCSAAVVFGREQPFGPAVSAAKAFFADDTSPIMAELAPQARRRRMRDGSTSIGVVSVASDPRVQVFVEQMRERELEQAIDRLRLIHNTAPKAVYLLSSIVADLTVDRVVSWPSLRDGPNPVEAAARDFGWFPVGWKAFNTAFPEQYQCTNHTTPTSAESPIYNFLLQNRHWWGLSTYTIENKGGLPRHVAFDPSRHPDGAIGALTSVFGAGVRVLSTTTAAEWLAANSNVDLDSAVAD